MKIKPWLAVVIIKALPVLLFVLAILIIGIVHHIKNENRPACVECQP